MLASPASTRVETGRTSDPGPHWPGDVHAYGHDPVPLLLAEVKQKQATISDVQLFTAAAARVGVGRALNVALASGQPPLDAVQRWASNGTT